MKITVALLFKVTSKPWQGVVKINQLALVNMAEIGVSEAADSRSGSGVG